ncbi:MAG: T4 family baseplate hub assembly chaperone [Pseudomonadales bacterium]
MKSLNADELLNVWEQGLSQPLLQRALILLAAAFPEINSGSLAKLSIGQRDLLLMQLRERLFGPLLLNRSVCPECYEQLEWQNNLSDFIVQVNKPSSEQHFELEQDEYKLQFRLPNSLDIAAVINSESEIPIQQQLLSHCVLSAKLEGSDYEPENLPKVLVQALMERIEQLDPQADIRINLACPECSHEWTVLFDIASFLWEEVNGWAERTLQTVYKLAVGYGWSEQQILSLSPVRRQLYLGMMGA